MCGPPFQALIERRPISNLAISSSKLNNFWGLFFSSEDRILSLILLNCYFSNTSFLPNWCNSPPPSSANLCLWNESFWLSILWCAHTHHGVGWGRWWYFTCCLRVCKCLQEACGSVHTGEGAFESLADKHRYSYAVYLLITHKTGIFIHLLHYSIHPPFIWEDQWTIGCHVKLIPGGPC